MNNFQGTSRIALLLSSLETEFRQRIQIQDIFYVFVCVWAGIEWAWTGQAEREKISNKNHPRNHQYSV